MLDFSQVRNKEMTYDELVAGLTTGVLRDLSDEMVTEQLRLIANCTDADVVFKPSDPSAHDPFAASEDEINIAWTLGHIIVHVTASSEESAFLAAELARGVPHREGRSRYEVDWQEVTSIQECRDRLGESRRMRLASLDLWPVDPHLDNSYDSHFGMVVNPVLQFVFGLSHDDSHLDHIKDVVRQALDARS
jgi:hypothetical protein